MNTIRLPKLLYVGLLLMLAACQGMGQSSLSASASLFQPGDSIDGMSLTTGAKDAPPLWSYCSPTQYNGNASIASCDVPLLSKLAIGHFLMPGDDALTMLDWSAISWELTIDDRPIDLQSFGTYDFVLPAMSHNSSPVREVFMTFTAWDVVLTDLTPGEHTIHGSATMGTDSYNWIMHLNIQGSDLGLDTP